MLATIIIWASMIFRYKDKELSKSGKLLACKAVFVKQTMIGVEVKYNKDKE